MAVATTAFSPVLTSALVITLFTDFASMLTSFCKSVIFAVLPMVTLLLLSPVVIFNATLSVLGLSEISMVVSLASLFTLLSAKAVTDVPPLDFNSPSIFTAASLCVSL